MGSGFCCQVLAASKKEKSEKKQSKNGQEMFVHRL